MTADLLNHPLDYVPVRIVRKVDTEDPFEPGPMFGSTAYGASVFFPKAVATRFALQPGAVVVCRLQENPGHRVPFRSTFVYPDRFERLDFRMIHLHGARIKDRLPDIQDCIYGTVDRGSFTPAQLFEEVYGREPAAEDADDQTILAQLTLFLMQEVSAGRLYETRLIRAQSSHVSEIWFSLSAEDARPAGAYEET